VERGLGIRVWHEEREGALKRRGVYLTNLQNITARQKNVDPNCLFPLKKTETFHR
jgi:hypothetical protein